MGLRYGLAERIDEFEKKEVELLHAYGMNGNLVRTVEKNKLLKEIREYSSVHGDANLAVEVIYLLFFNTSGLLYSVKRGDKAENPFMYCKTVGGHVKAGESYISALIRESQEEIGIKVIFSDMEKLHQVVEKTDVTKFAVVGAIDYAPWMKSIRCTSDGRYWIKRHNAMIFAGVYDGAVEFKDGEAVDMELINPRMIQKEASGRFTYDLKVLFERYSTILDTCNLLKG